MKGQIVYILGLADHVLSLSHSVLVLGFKNNPLKM